MTLQAVQGQQVRAETTAGTGSLDTQNTRANDAPHHEELLNGAHSAHLQQVALHCNEFLNRCVAGQCLQGLLLLHLLQFDALLKDVHEHNKVIMERVVLRARTNQVP
jgi:hypothetical protein